jgi:hypothetical protein
MAAQPSHPRPSDRATLYFIGFPLYRVNRVRYHPYYTFGNALWRLTS